MYHPRKFTTLRLLAVLFLVISHAFVLPGAGAAKPIYVASSAEKGQEVAEIKTPFPVVIKGKSYKHKPTHALIYQYDSSPLGKRTPLLIVHGLRAEYYPCFRWEKVIKRLQASQEFSNKFKIYLARYDTIGPLDKAVPQLRERINELYNSAGKKQIAILALSIGGNLSYEAMLDPVTDKQVSMLMAMGTPFHGSPLFSADWLNYGIYKNLSSPWTRIDHAVAYRLYFSRNPNLLYDMRWDNSDYAIPDIGRFKSRLPFGPRGNLSAERSVNKRMVMINDDNFDKNKLIVYGGYMINPYMLPEAARVLEDAIMLPYTMLTMAVPAHFGREHPVLKMLNRVIATVVTTEEAAKRNKTNFVYGLNDGITPVSSALFLPDTVCAKESVAREADLLKIKPLIDVRTARVFRNLDHLTYIEGSRPTIALPAMRDELNPGLGSRDMFDWILYDLDCAAGKQINTAADNIIKTY